MNLAKSAAIGLLANTLQHRSSARFKDLARQGLALLCSWLVLMSGALAAHPAWHAVFHDHRDEAPASASAGDRDPAGLPDHGDEASCVLCAFANQQVESSGPALPSGPVTGRVEWADLPAAETVRLEGAWPEPSGRGPPFGE